MRTGGVECTREISLPVKCLHVDTKGFYKLTILEGGLLRRFSDTTQTMALPYVKIVTKRLLVTNNTMSLYLWKL